MVQNVQYLRGLPSHVTLPFEYWKPILSGIQVCSIQMVSVFCILGRRDLPVFTSSQKTKDWADTITGKVATIYKQFVIVNRQLFKLSYFI